MELINTFHRKELEVAYSQPEENEVEIIGAHIYSKNKKVNIICVNNPSGSNRQLGAKIEEVINKLPTEEKKYANFR